MMDCPELAVLDVGHGSCTLIRDGGRTVVIDAPEGPEELLQALQLHGVNIIDTVLISHAHADHVGGVLALFTQPNLSVRRIYLNPDAAQQTNLWETLRRTLKYARRSDPGLEVNTALTSTTSGQLNTGRLRIEVLGPSPELALAGAGGYSEEGRAVSSHTLCAVLRVADESSRGVLLMGDLDEHGFDRLLEDGQELGADALLFPHHGGRPGGADPARFARRVADATGASTVVFSVSHGHKDKPRPEVIAGVRASLPNVHVACTQLSAECAAESPLDQEHLGKLPARGRASRTCCAGTIEFHFTPGGLVARRLPLHAAYVDGIDEAMCRR